MTEMIVKKPLKLKLQVENDSSFHSNESEKDAVILFSPDTQKHTNPIAKLEYFRQLPFYKQKSKKWLEQRNQYLTGSIIATALGLTGSVARKKLLINKASNGQINYFYGNEATNWGNKYETPARQIYSYRNAIEVYEFGLIPSQQYGILGVSPDGIMLNKMLEIKCPWSRVIDGKIKIDYYHQMQEQMHVCNYTQCDFLECRFVELLPDQFWDDFNYYDAKINPNREKGLILLCLSVDSETAEIEIEYLYSPIDYHLDQIKLKTWEIETIQSLSTQKSRIYIQTIYWNLSIYRCQSVNRDPQWINKYYSKLVQFWTEVLYYREHGIDSLLEDTESGQTKSEVQLQSAPNRILHLPKTIKESNETQTEGDSLLKGHCFL